jgi:hypothetical protein
MFSKWATAVIFEAVSIRWRLNASAEIANTFVANLILKAV